MKTPDKFEIINELAKRRGLFWPYCEIYGGVSGFVTFGPMGTIIKKKIEDKFRDFFFRRLGLYEIESPVIVPGKVFKASGHVSNFKEPMVECKACKRRFRGDHLLQEFSGMSETETDNLNLSSLKTEMDKYKIRCPECNNEFGAPKQFLTMFVTNIGPYSKSIGYGRPEAAQGIFTEFRRLYEYAREKLPFGVAQIGHALRNEISPRQGPIRLREFTIIDLEFFFDPEDPFCALLKDVENEVLRLIILANRLQGEDEPFEVTVKEALKQGYIKEEWQAFFMALAKCFLVGLGVPEDKQRFIEKFDWERAHYSKQGFDQQVYLERWGWVEVSGHNYRTDYDLKRHMQSSGVDMRVFKKNGRPTVIEEITLKPIMSKVGPVFKEKTSRIVKLLSVADSKEIEKSFSKKGYYEVESFKILPEHVEIIRSRVKEEGRRFIPHVIEPSFGLDRLFYVTIEYAYQTNQGRTLLSLPRDLSSIDLGVFPLVSKDGLPDEAKRIFQILINDGFTVEYDESGSIGRRYARVDEVGVPLSITIDYQTLKDNTVTIRDRDSKKQVRNNVERLPELFRAFFSYNLDFDDLG